MLEAADGSRYVMQAYAQIIDKKLDYAALPTLGGKLKLPSGWRYLSMVPADDLVLGAAGKATWCRTSSKTPIRSSIDVLGKRSGHSMMRP